MYAGWKEKRQSVWNVKLSFTELPLSDKIVPAFFNIHLNRLCRIERKRKFPFPRSTISAWKTKAFVSSCKARVERCGVSSPIAFFVRKPFLLGEGGAKRALRDTSDREMRDRLPNSTTATNLHDAAKIASAKKKRENVSPFEGALLCFYVCRISANSRVRTVSARKASNHQQHPRICPTHFSSSRAMYICSNIP